MKKEKILLLVVIIGIILAVKYSPLSNYLSFSYMREQAYYLKELSSQAIILSVLSYILLYIFLVTFSIPGATPLTLLAGFLYGIPLGTVYVNIGATLGAIGSFLIARYLIGKSIQKRYEKQLATFNGNIKKNGISYLLALRIIPIFPFFIVNNIAGFTNVSLSTFAWTTSLGIIPGTIAFAFVGKQIDSIYSPQDILSTRMIIGLAVLTLLILLPVILKFLGIIKNGNKPTLE